jgi:Ca2+-transporting ATPase
MSLSSAQILHSLSCRSRRHSLFDRLEGQAPLQPNRYLRLAIGGTLGLQAASLILPGLRAVLGIAPLTLFDGLLIGTSAIWPLMINEATKRRLKAE